MKLDEEFRQAYLERFEGRQHDRRDVCLFAEGLLRTKLVAFSVALRRQETQPEYADSDDRMFARGYNQCAREVNREIERKLLIWGIEADSGSKTAPERNTGVDHNG